MGSFDDYRREESPILEEGNYRVVITDAKETVSQTSKRPMIVFEVQPNNSKIKIRNYLVKNEYFNRNATKIFDSFNINAGDFNLITWIGAVGAARIEKNNDGYLAVKYWISKEKASKLPPWEGEVPQRQTVTDIDAPSGFTKVENDNPPWSDDEVPF